MGGMGVVSHRWTRGPVTWLSPRSDATLLAGDAITTVNLDSLIAIVAKTQRVCVHDNGYRGLEAARESVRLLASLEPFTIACGHGVLMTGMHATQD